MYLVKARLSLLVKMYLCLHCLCGATYVESRHWQVHDSESPGYRIPRLFGIPKWLFGQKLVYFQNSRDLFGQESESINFYQIY
jgi:hypothetical protein